MANFSDLNDDTIVAVLLNCDILTILRVEQVRVQICPSLYHVADIYTTKTCKHLKNLTSSRHLWLSLVKELDHDYAPVLLPHESLQSLRTERLRDMAIRSTRGYLNWTSSKGPKVTRTSVLDLLEAQGHGIILGMLVSGGKYFVFQAVDGCFHCYDTEKQLNICSYQGAPFDVEEIQYMDCLVDDDGTSLILAYVAFKELGRRQCVQFCRNIIFSNYLIGNARNILVVRLDIQSGTSTIVRSFLCSVAESDDNGLGYYSPVYDKARKIKVNNNVVAAAIYNHIFVADWRTGKCVITEELVSCVDFGRMLNCLTIYVFRATYPASIFLRSMSYAPSARVRAEYRSQLPLYLLYSQLETFPQSDRMVTLSCQYLSGPRTSSSMSPHSHIRKSYKAMWLTQT